MSLAHDVGLSVPPVFRRYTAQPIYLIERFDRRILPEGRTECRYIIDGCQLLNKSPALKYRAATPATLAHITSIQLECTVIAPWCNRWSA
jgi:serine/threonine-protein kinase HipA